MTAFEIYDAIMEGAKDPETGSYIMIKLIDAYYYADTMEKNMAYIQKAFGCDSDTARNVFKIFKEKEASGLLTPEQAAANNAACAAAMAAEQNKPKCPTCGSKDIKPISGINRGVSVAVFGIFSKKINKSFECKHCGYTW